MEKEKIHQGKMNTIPLSKGHRYGIRFNSNPITNLDQLHYHDFYEIFLLISGELKYEVEQETFDLCMGDILFIPPRAEHRPIQSGLSGSTRCVLQMDESLPEELLNENLPMPFSLPLFFEVDHSALSRIIELIRQLQEEQVSNLQCRSLMERTLLTQILILLVRDAKSSESDSSPVAYASNAANSSPVDYASPAANSLNAANVSPASNSLNAANSSPASNSSNAVNASPAANSLNAANASPASNSSNAAYVSPAEYSSPTADSSPVADSSTAVGPSYSADLSVSAVSATAIHPRSNRSRTQIHSAAIGLSYYIDTHFAKEISFQQLSHRLGVERTRLTREFRAIYGQSPHEYLINRRLTAAYESILSGTPPTVAASQSGFRDYSNFYRQFHRKYGIAPSQFTK